MKSVALKRSDRLQTQILVITWVTVCTLFCLIPLFITTESSNLLPHYKYNARYTYNGDYTYKISTKNLTAAYEQSVKCLENAGK